MLPKTLKVMREIAWLKLPGMDYLSSVKIALRPRVMMRPDFPVSLNFARELTKKDIVLELGANVGGNTKELPKYAKFVHAFEPAPQCYRWLRRNTKGIPNLRCYNLAVSDETRLAQSFNLQFGSGSLFNHDVFGWKARIPVDVIGINELPFKYNVMLMDCEGAEVPIFHAFKKWDMVDRIYVETHVIDGRPTMPEVKHMLSSHYDDLVEDVDPSGSFPWLVARRS